MTTAAKETPHRLKNVASKVNDYDVQRNCYDRLSKAAAVLKTEASRVGGGRYCGTLDHADDAIFISDNKSGRGGNQPITASN